MRRLDGVGVAPVDPLVGHDVGQQLEHGAGAGEVRSGRPLLVQHVDQLRVERIGVDLLLGVIGREHRRVVEPARTLVGVLIEGRGLSGRCAIHALEQALADESVDLFVVDRRALGDDPVGAGLQLVHDAEFHLHKRRIEPAELAVTLGQREEHAHTGRIAGELQ